MKPKEPDSTDKVKDLPPKPMQPKSADKVVGGRAGGDDDDLEELQVQRKPPKKP
jgi:hypothetical protein